MSEYLSFETERLLLRPMDLEDAPFLLELINTPKWLQFIGDRKVRNLNDAEEYIKVKVLPQLKRLGYGNYTLIRKSDQVKLGSCGIYDREGMEGVDIGFSMLPAYERQGYAYEAATCLIEAARTRFGIEYLQGITIRENIASQNLLKKLGLEFKEIIRLPDDPEDLMLFAMDLIDRPA